jgi:hypothetical protein
MHDLHNFKEHAEDGQETAAEAEKESSEGEDEVNGENVQAEGKAGTKLLITAENLLALFHRVVDTRHTSVPAHIIAFPRGRTVRQYSKAYHWRLRKPHFVGPHRFAGAHPELMDMYVKSVRTLNCKILALDELLVAAKIEKAQRRALWLLPKAITMTRWRAPQAQSGMKKYFKKVFPKSCVCAGGGEGSSSTGCRSITSYS